MRIAQVSPLYESVPPQLYGGTERVVSYLTEELVRQGHEVTLFASGDSVTKARLEAVTQRSLRLDPSCQDQLSHHLRMLEMVYSETDRFDLIHFHIDYLHFPATRRQSVPSLTTLHGRLDLPDLVPLYREYVEMPVVSISLSQRKPLPWLNWVGNVPHGLPAELYQFHAQPKPYLVFVGRISPEKRLDRAIEIARRVGMPLKVAAKLADVDRIYFEEKIRPIIEREPLVEYLGEVNDKEKNALVGNAYALLFPIDWPEPFGLVMIEAMACGTPVIAWKLGAVPEVIESQINGAIVEDIDQAVQAVEQLATFDRYACRQSFERRFSGERMVKGYLEIYRGLVRQNPSWRKSGRNIGAEKSDLRTSDLFAC